MEEDHQMLHSLKIVAGVAATLALSLSLLAGTPATTEAAAASESAAAPTTACTSTTYAAGFYTYSTIGTCGWPVSYSYLSGYVPTTTYVATNGLYRYSPSLLSLGTAAYYGSPYGAYAPASTPSLVTYPTVTSVTAPSYYSTLVPATTVVPLSNYTGYVATPPTVTLTGTYYNYLGYSTYYRYGLR